MTLLAPDPVLDGYTPPAAAELSKAEILALIAEAERATFFASLTEEAAAALRWEWEFWARPDQLAPTTPWSVWMIRSGRGVGKTRSGSEWVRKKGPAAREGVLIGANPRDVRDLMIEGRSGLLQISPPWERPRYEPSKLKLTWPNGAVAHIRSAEDPESVRGLSVEWGWCIPAGEPVETSVGPRPIEDIQAGDLVWTRAGLRAVQWAGATKVVVELVRIRLADGRSLRCTPEHQVLVDGLWIEAQHVTPGSNVWAWTNTPTLNPAPPLTTPGEAFGGIEPARVTTRIGPASSCTASSPASAIRLSTSTTSTRTRATTLDRTLSHSPDWNIWAAGTSAPAGRPGTSTVEALCPVRRGASERPAPSSVISAAGHSSAPGCEPSSAHRPVGQPMAVLDVERLSCPPTTVYDLTVEGDPEFFAGGMVVHNCDEIAKWRYLQETWDMLRFAMREGVNPQTLVTTTPKPLPLIIQLAEGRFPGIINAPVVSTYRNKAHLAEQFISEIAMSFEGTRLGAQELHGAILTDVEGALWSWALIEAARWPQDRWTEVNGIWRPGLPEMKRKVCAVDPSGSKGGAETGIVVVGIDKGRPPVAYVLDDRSVRGSPYDWARAALRAYVDNDCNVMIGERNYGGDMVEHTIKTMPAERDPVTGKEYPSGDYIRFDEVSAGIGKKLRAEPTVALYEQTAKGFRRVYHVGTFGDLESQLTGWVPDESPTSPDRLDALVWAVNYLIGGKTYRGRTSNASALTTMHVG